MPFREAHVPAPKGDGPVDFFPTPRGTSWTDVSIRSIDGNTVSIQVKWEHRVCNYTQMGMVNQKNGNPSIHLISRSAVPAPPSE